MRRTPLSIRNASVLVLFAVGCAEGDAELHAAWPMSSYAAAFVVTLQGSAIVDIQGPLGLEGGEVTYGSTVIRVAEDVKTHLLGFSSEAIEAIVPLLDPTRLSDLELTVGNETCLEGRYERALGLVHLPVSTSIATLSTLDPSSLTFIEHPDLSSLPGSFVLKVPLSEDRCVESPIQGWRPFGATRELSSPDGPLDLYDVEILDPGRVLIATNRGLHIVERGGELELEDPVLFWSGDNLGSTADRIWAPRKISLEPIGDGRHHIIASVQHVERASGRRADQTMVVEMTWTSTAGFSSHRQSPPVPVGMRALHVREDGAVVTLGPEGYSMSGPSVETMEAWQVDTPEELSLIAPTGDPEDPYLVLSEQGGLHIGDPFDKRLRPDRSFNFVSTPASLVTRASPDGYEAFVPLYSTQVHRRDASGSWAPFRFYVSPEAQVCTRQEDECGLPQVINPALDIERLGEDQLLMPARSCVGFFQVNVARQCAVVIPELGQPFEGTDLDYGLRAVAIGFGKVVMAGSAGLMIEADVE